MEEKDFEKKSKKKGLIIFIVILAIILLALGGGYAYLKIANKPEKLFGKLIDEAFELKEDVKSYRMELGIAASVNTDNENLKAIIEGLKVKSITEIDLNKKIFNENLKISHEDNSIIDLNALIENDKAYIYSKDLFSKYIQIPEEDVGDLKNVFTQTDTDNKALENDFKQILKDELKPERLSQENVTLNGKRTTKSTLKLTAKETLELTNKVLSKAYDYTKEENLKTLIEEIDTTIKDEEYNSKDYIEITLYTQGLKSELVKAEINVVDMDYEEIVLLLEINIETKNKYEIRVLSNEESTKKEEAAEMFTVKVHLEDEHNGTIKVKMNLDENSSIIIRMNVKEEINPTIENRDVQNSVNMNELTELDYMEIYNNLQKNEILYNIFLSLMFNTDNDEDLEFDNDDYYEFQEPEDINNLVENVV